MGELNRRATRCRQFLYVSVRWTAIRHQDAVLALRGFLPYVALRMERQFRANGSRPTEAGNNPNQTTPSRPVAHKRLFHARHRREPTNQRTLCLDKESRRRLVSTRYSSYSSSAGIPSANVCVSKLGGVPRSLPLVTAFCAARTTGTETLAMSAPLPGTEAGLHHRDQLSPSSGDRSRTSRGRS
jgi:hypothetical protein